MNHRPLKRQASILKTNFPKIISIALMALLTVNSSVNLVSYVSTRLSSPSALIPDYVIAELAQPYLITGLFETIIIGLSLLLLFQNKYKLVIAICMSAMVAELFL